MKQHLLKIAILALLVVGGRQALAQTNAKEDAPKPIDADIVLRGGAVHLGDGEPAKVGDVAIRGEKIVAVGEFETGKVRQQIDCRGLVVCPGFIDLHNHSDRQVLQNSTRAVVNFLTQGCTTIVTGNCGSGPVDVGQYYAAMKEHGVGVNVVHLLPQGALRRQAIGNVRRKATPQELERMKQLAEKAMQNGAWGMSTGLIYVPSSYADTEELVEIAKVVGRYDGIYASHIRNENVELLSAVEEAMEIGRQANTAVHISHFKSSGKDSWGLVRVAAQMIDKARRENRRVTADQYPYTASSTSLDATLIPAWARSGGRTKMLARITDPKDAPRIREAITKKLRELDGGQRLQIAYYARQPSWAGKRLAQIAEDENVDPLEMVMRIVRGGGASIVNHSINEEDVRYVMTLPWVATASDGRAYVPGAGAVHPRNYGTFPRKLGHYSLAEKVIPLEKAVRSASGLPADILGLKDRGYLRPGMMADITVFDAKRLIDAATFEDPHNYSRGVVHVLVNGSPAITRGSPTGSLSGRPLRKMDRRGTSPIPPGASQGLASDQAAKIDRLFAAWDKPNVPGAALGVVHEGKLVYSRGYGSANLDYGSPITSDSVFYMASVSKQFVAACIGLLAVEGKLSLDDDVRKFVPELPKYEKTITVRQLVHHTSGLRDYLTLMGLAGKRYADVHSTDELLELICRQKTLNFDPGSAYMYCNTGYLLMGEIVKRVSGKSLAQYAEEKIFRPLNMNRTRFHDNHQQIIPGRVISYAKTGENFRISYLGNWEQVGSGGLLSTVEDMVRWDENFYSHQVGGSELHELLQTPGKLNNGPNQGRATSYAFGLQLGEHKGLRTVAHSGSFMGFKTHLLRLPEARFTVIILANRGDANPGQLATKIVDICLADRLQKSLGRYLGPYHSAELATTFEIRAKGAELVLQQNGRTTNLSPTGAPGEFEGGGWKLRFSGGDGPAPRGFVLDAGRAKGIEFTRRK